MEHKILTFLVFIGFSITPVYQKPTKLFFFKSTSKIFPDAQLYCRQAYTDLATIENMDDLKKLQTNVSYSTAWIGLKKIGPPLWHWALSDKQFYNEGETEYRNWAHSETDDVLGKDCVVMDDKGEFWDDYCTYTFHFICYDEKNIEQKYIYMNVSLTWRDAQSYCRQYHTELVSVRNQNENQQIQQLIPRKEMAYIGLFKDSYVWSDGSSSSFRNWDLGQPDISGKCSAVYENKLWSNRNCDVGRPFFCYATYEKKQILRMEVKSPLNVNDPTIKEAILVWLQKTLKQGWTDDVTMTWRMQQDGRVFRKMNTFEPQSSNGSSACPDHYSGRKM